jgi:hypothetical protein
VCVNLQRIKFCMAEGITVVLVHCESLYESLYDLLNQHYTELSSGQLFVRLAFGSHSRLCPIARGFRVVVIVEKADAYTRLAPPLLNRFEKQVLEWRDLIPDRLRPVERALKDFLAVLSGVELADAGAGLHRRVRETTISGFHAETVSSLLLSLGSTSPEHSTEDEDVDLQDLISEGLCQLIWLCSPEAICRALKGPAREYLAKQHSIDLRAAYFSEQEHSDVPSLLRRHLGAWADAGGGHGEQLCLLTHASISRTLDDQLEAMALESDTPLTVRSIVLHELSSAEDLESELKAYY